MTEDLEVDACVVGGGFAGLVAPTAWRTVAYRSWS